MLLLSLLHHRPPSVPIPSRKSENMLAIQTFFLQVSVSVLLSSHSSVTTRCRKVFVKFTILCWSEASPLTIVSGNVDKKPYDRTEVWLGLPRKGQWLLTLSIFSRYTNSYADFPCKLQLNTEFYLFIFLLVNYMIVSYQLSRWITIVCCRNSTGMWCLCFSEIWL